MRAEWRVAQDGCTTIPYHFYTSEQRKRTTGHGRSRALTLALHWMAAHSEQCTLTHQLAGESLEDGISTELELCEVSVTDTGIYNTSKITFVLITNYRMRIVEVDGIIMLKI